jgi:hypothetical protein
MNTKLWAILTALASATIALPAAAGGVDFKSETFPLEKNLAVDIAAPGAVRVEIGISIPSLREELRYELGVDQQGQLSGGIYIPAGDSASIEVRAFDARGEAIYKGAGAAEIGKELTSEFRVPLEGRESQEPLYARFGTQLLTAGIVGGTDELLQVQVALLGAYGGLEFSPEDLEWKLPDGFPEIKYSCFNGALCILEWKPTREQEVIAMCLKLKPQPCFEGPPPVQVRRRGPESHLRVDHHRRDPLLGRQFRRPAGSAESVLRVSRLQPGADRRAVPSGRGLQVPLASRGWRSHLCRGHERQGLVLG